MYAPSNGLVHMLPALFKAESRMMLTSCKSLEGEERREVSIDGETISSIARDLGL